MSFVIKGYTYTGFNAYLVPNIRRIRPFSFFWNTIDTQLDYSNCHYYYSLLLLFSILKTMLTLALFLGSRKSDCGTTK